jgi:hypothetical protein
MEEEFGPDDPILPDLRAQLGSLEKAGRPLSECGPNPITLNDRGE